MCKTENTQRIDSTQGLTWKTLNMEENPWEQRIAISERYTKEYHITTLFG